MTSAKYFDAFSLVVTRGHSWSLVCTFRHDRLRSTNRKKELKLQTVQENKDPFIRSQH